MSTQSTASFSKQHELLQINPAHGRETQCVATNIVSYSQLSTKTHTMFFVCWPHTWGVLHVKSPLLLRLSFLASIVLSCRPHLQPSMCVKERGFMLAFWCPLVPMGVWILCVWLMALSGKWFWLQISETASNTPDTCFSPIRSVEHMQACSALTRSH